ncbi:MAG: HAMP domain-containing histidine kinase [Lachnospiraceae bacterium]|nr:HAMP domain-containing histidine kinase [Lachnospiraceae bacterium]
MKKKIIWITILFLFLYVGGAAFLYNSIIDQESDGDYVNVQVNEVKQLGLAGEFADEKAKEAFSEAADSLMETAGALSQEGYHIQIRKVVLGMTVLCCLFLLLIFLYVYFKIIRPFSVLENYAGEIAKGNLDISLPYERTNYFGEFTWAFDHMRGEIRKARACEKEAIENNKTVIATLSHDIKTPIASIRAYAEGLEANMDSGAERRQRYISVIMKKCDEVTKLTNDMFLHSLADLEKLKLDVETIWLKPVMMEFVKEMNGDKDDIHIIGEIPDICIEGDRKRLIQVFGNLIGNSRKYAGNGNSRQAGSIEVSVKTQVAGGKNREAVICFEDYGPGIPDEDMPFIFEKFYRGKNAGTEEGAGLGLYIVKYIMEQMDGSVEAANTGEGLSVSLHLKIS